MIIRATSDAWSTRVHAVGPIRGEPSTRTCRDHNTGHRGGSHLLYMSEDTMIIRLLRTCTYTSVRVTCAIPCTKVLPVLLQSGMTTHRSTACEAVVLLLYIHTRHSKFQVHQPLWAVDHSCTVAGTCCRLPAPMCSPWGFGTVPLYPAQDVSAAVTGVMVYTHANATLFCVHVSLTLKRVNFKLTCTRTHKHIPSN